MRRVINVLRNSTLCEPLKTQILSAVDAVEFKGLTIIRIAIPKDGTGRQLREGLDQDVHRIVVVHPGIEAWLFPEEPDPRNYVRIRSRQESRPLPEVMRTAAKAINLQGLQARDRSFAQFIEAITS